MDRPSSLLRSHSQGGQHEEESIREANSREAKAHVHRSGSLLRTGTECLRSVERWLGPRHNSASGNLFRATRFLGYGHAATPLLWALVGFLLSKSYRSHALIALIAIMIAHYGGAIILLTVGRFAEWDNFWSLVNSADSFGVLIVVGLLFYVGGQTILWLALARVTARGR